MASVVMIHGIGHQFRARDRTRSAWIQALAEGLHSSHLPSVPELEIDIVHYGNCFRRKGTKASPSISDAGDSPIDELATVPDYGAADVEDGFEWEFLDAIDAELAGTGGTDTKVYAPAAVQSMIRRLDQAELLPAGGRSAIIGLVKQVRRYLHEDDLRSRVQERVEATVGTETRVLVGHSLGSVVAYEALMSHPEWNVHTLVTCGSPLGLRTVNRLVRPGAREDGFAPPAVARWVNVAASEDAVASVKELEPLFGTPEDQLIANGRLRAHSVLRYLTSSEVCEAITHGLG